MEELKGYKFDNLPLGELKKVADLIEYDGPILSHFVDEKSRSYLFYWVDHDNKVNRWLVWKISDDQLYYYLKGTLTLKELLEESNKDFIYSVEIGDSFVYTNIVAIDILDIPESYKIEEESTYQYSIPPVYNLFIESFEKDFYLVKLRENALYFTLKPKSPQFSSTVSADDAGSFLKKLSGSFLNFIEYDFFNRYKSVFADYRQLNKTVGEFKATLSPRIVSLEYSSFKVGVSTDTIKEIDSRFTNWQKEVLGNYKDEVINVDYSNDEAIQNIADKYPENVRKAIFAPIIDIMNDKDYNTEITNYRRTFKKVFKNIPKSKKSILLPLNLDIEEIENKHLYSFTIELPTDQDIFSLSKKDIKQGILSHKEVPVADLTLDSFSESGYQIFLKHPINYFYKLDGLFGVAFSDEFEINEQAGDKETALAKFRRKFIEHYLGILSKSSSLKQTTITSYLSVVENLTQDPHSS